MIKIIKWKCNKCGHLTEENHDTESRFIPESGWGCKNIIGEQECEGRRKRIQNQGRIKVEGNLRCLMCGKAFKHIGSHLSFIHKISSVEYLIRFPGAKLVDEETREIYSKTTAESYTPELRETRRKWYKEWSSKKENKEKWYKEVCKSNKIAGLKMVGRKRPECGHPSWNEGLTNETSEKIKQASLLRTGKHRSEESRLKIKAAGIKRAKENKVWLERVTKANRINAQKRKGIPRPPEVLAKILHPKKPTSIERQFIELSKEYNLPYKYVGNGEVWISNMNPDFINVDGKKEVIELYGTYWHRGQNPQDRIDKFKKYGFDCKVLWEKDFIQGNWKEIVLSKIAQSNEII